MATLSPNEAASPARNVSPFKHPRPPPDTLAKTAKLWDKYERQALETAMKREKTTKPSQPPPLMIPSKSSGYRPEEGSPTRPGFDFKFRRSHAATPLTTVAICKTCTLPITYTSGVCEGCTRTIVLPSASGETTPPLSPAARNFASTDLQKLRKSSLNEDVVIPTSTSSRRTSYCPLPAHYSDPSFRLSTLQPPPDLESFSELGRRRKTSLTDPNEPLFRLQVAQQSHVPRSAMNSPPITPTSPPWAAHSRCSTRRSSLANPLMPTSAYPHARTDSLALSEFSTLCPYTSTVTTSRPSLSQVDTALENTTSAWDDWDSDSDDRLGLAGWMGRRKTKSRTGGAREGKGSMDSTDSDREPRRPSTSPEKIQKQSRKSSSKEDQRLERARIEAAENARTVRRDLERQAAKKKPSGFIRVISCGRGDNDG
ncbi:hypothetical protein G6011_06675 [Alternaria panax]|uniref:Uncharacterized protein n=1 Tax=Alternaria panax TaxID=48097 RepID=A0AAD4I899_9PLEO|nr:hypothetical protein G6011_06675 [Alternaria panax]